MENITRQHYQNIISGYTTSATLKQHFSSEITLSYFAGDYKHRVKYAAFHIDLIEASPLESRMNDKYVYYGNFKNITLFP